VSDHIRGEGGLKRSNLRARAFARRMWFFSAETVRAQEVEFINEHPLDFSAFLPWLARALLSALCLLAVLAWIILNANSGNGGTALVADAK